MTIDIGDLVMKKNIIELTKDTPLEEILDYVYKGYTAKYEDISSYTKYSLKNNHIVITHYDLCLTEEEFKEKSEYFEKPENNKFILIMYN